MPKLQPDELQTLLQTAEDSFPHDFCYTCECFLGYLTLLRIDADPSARDLLTRFAVERKDMHQCLGCDPCPPGNLYAEYMKKKQSSRLIRL